VKGSKGIVQDIFDSHNIAERIDIEVLSWEFKMSGVNNNSEEGKKPNEQGAHINLKVKGQVCSFVCKLFVSFHF